MNRSSSSDKNRNLDWLMSQNLSEYEGCWVSIVNQEIVFKGKSLRECRGRKSPMGNPRPTEGGPFSS